MTIMTQKRDSTGRTGPVVAVDHVHKRFPGGVQALRGVSLEVRSGQVLGLLGHNGAGKTTLIRVLAGLLTPDQGSSTVLGLDPVHQGDDVRRQIGVLPAQGLLDPRFSAWENIEFAGRLFGMEATEIRRRGEKLLHELGLEGRVHDQVGSYSSGMRQRAALARVLLPGPQLLLLDEPTAALDPVAVRDVRDRVRSLARDSGTTVVLCTHDLTEAAELCDEFVILSQGQVLTRGTPEELRALHSRGGRTVVEVAAEHLDQAVALLATRWQVTDLGGGRIALPAADRTETADAVSRLAAASIPVFSVETEDVSLEDLYLSLHRPQEGSTTPEDHR